MADYSEVFVGIDTSKLRNAVAIAQGGRNGEVRYLGEFDNTEAATSKLVKKLAAQHRRLTFCYEAGPTGYGLHRLIKTLGHECVEQLGVGARLAHGSELGPDAGEQRHERLLAGRPNSGRGRQAEASILVK